MTTCMESSNNFVYMLYNLLGEVGELVEKIDYGSDFGLCDIADRLQSYGKVAKRIRKEPELPYVKYLVEDYNLCTIDYKKDENIQKEIGDVLWQLSGLCSVLGLHLDDVAQQNLDKLASRKERGQIDGSGDNR